MKKHSLKSILAIFSEVPDPRDPDRCTYPLSSLLFIALCTLLSNGEDYVDMAEYAQQRRSWLLTKVALPADRSPSHDTFNRLFLILSPDSLARCLGQDGHHLLAHLEEKQLCFDGKKLRGSCPGSKGNAGIYVLNAWVGENRLCIGQKKVEEKSNEITAIPALLDELSIEGSVVTIDAMGCQTDIAQLIIEKQADYLLAVKANQGGLLEELEDCFRFQATDTESFEEKWAYAHGRHEQRNCQILPVDKMLNPQLVQRWSGLKTLVKVSAKRQPKAKALSTETRFYISSESQPSARYFNSLVRGHWAIENQLHWHLDVTFKEDQATVRKGNGPQNMSALRKIALNRVGMMNDKKSLKKRRFAAGLNLLYLEEILKV
jgi:predicted transposase YbfD/YdcC